MVLCSIVSPMFLNFCFLWLSSSNPLLETIFLLILSLNLVLMYSLIYPLTRSFSSLNLQLYSLLLICSLPHESSFLLACLWFHEETIGGRLSRINNKVMILSRTMVHFVYLMKHKDKYQWKLEQETHNMSILEQHTWKLEQETHINGSLNSILIVLWKNMALVLEWKVCGARTRKSMHFWVIFNKLP